VYLCFLLINIFVTVPDFKQKKGPILFSYKNIKEYLLFADKILLLLKPYTI